MIRPRQLWRMLQIQRVLLKHGLDELVSAAHLFRPLARIRRIPGLGPGKAARTQPIGVRIREALVELGPIFVKFGQALSTRRDLLPRDVADELAKLQDRVPPFPAAETHRQLAAAYRKPLETLFARFDDEPLAAASIAQVHTAALPDGREAIVKVLRPGVREQIRRDVEVLHALAGLAERYWADVRRLRPREVVREFDNTLMNELDLMREAANAAQLRRNFEGSTLLYVPEVYWDWCRPGVLVMERIHGINIGATAKLHEAGIDMRRLSANGVEIFFTQVFRHNFFHADMHPGNIFVAREHPHDPQYIAIDCGIVGSLTREDQDYLARNLLAFFHQDYYEVAALHIESGWVGENTRANEFAAAIRTVCEPILEKPLKDISFGQVLLGLFQTARRFDMEVQPQLVLLQKTLLNIEGLGRQLYPDLDLWKTAKPFLEQWMKERAGTRGFWESLKRQAPELTRQLPELPVLAHQALSQMDQEKRQRRRQGEALGGIRQQLIREGRRGRRLRLGLLLVALALAWQPLIQWAAGQPWPALAAAVLGLALLAWH